MLIQTINTLGSTAAGTDPNAMSPNAISSLLVFILIGLGYTLLAALGHRRKRQRR